MNLFLYENTLGVGLKLRACHAAKPPTPHSACTSRSFDRFPQIALLSSPLHRRRSPPPQAPPPRRLPELRCCHQPTQRRLLLLLRHPPIAAAWFVGEPRALTFSRGAADPARIDREVKGKDSTPDHLSICHFLPLHF